jgi:adenine-specific DNA-methyltransferase
MKKLKMHTPDMTLENIDKVAAIFPNCLVETKDEKTGELRRAIDFDQLRQELSHRIVEGPRERYHLDWPGKREALLAANAPIAKSLRPCFEESVDFDATKNLFIEGDNLDALKLLQETYLGKVKMIYIDPPYNTGSDLIYNDDFKQSVEAYFKVSNQQDHEFNRLTTNTESNGRFHSDWLTMMFARLKLARNLLRNDGIIFISVGERELANLRKLSDLIFGEANFVSIIPRVMKTTSFKGTFFAPSLDYVICYAKSIFEAIPFTEDVEIKQFKRVETSGPRTGERYRDDTAFYLSTLDITRGSYNQRYWIDCPDGTKVIPPGKTFPPEKGVAGDGVWRWGYETYVKQKHLIVFKETNRSPLLDENGKQAKYNLYTKSYLIDRQEKGKLPRNYFIDTVLNRNGTELLNSMAIPFSYSKPIELINWMLNIIQSKSDDIILDFFAGSATTAHAVMALNASDGGDRRFILVQFPEACEAQSEAHNAGFRNISDIAKARIRKAGKELKMQKTTTNQRLDIGFRVLKIDTSNMADVYYAPDVVKRTDLVAHSDNIKPDRTPEDLLFQVLVDWGVDLSLPITQENVTKKKVFFVDGNALVACFDSKVSEDLVKQLAKRKPLRAVFRDSSYDSDSVKINVEQIFKLLSPETEVKTL